MSDLWIETAQAARRWCAAAALAVVSGLRSATRWVATRVLWPSRVPDRVAAGHRGLGPAPRSRRRVAGLARGSVIAEPVDMPMLPPHGCASPGCPELVRHAPRCVAHTRAVSREADQWRGSSAARGYGARWRALRLRYLREHPLCAHCAERGLTVSATDVDHVVSRARGGSDRDGNLQALCHSCHSAKTAREDGAFGRACRS